jgi:hypothetical protein
MLRKILCFFGFHKYTDKIIPFDVIWWNKNVNKSKQYLMNNIKSNKLDVIVYEECICGKIRNCVKCNININR